MVSVLAYPKPLLDICKQTAITTVLPAPDGCDLNCRFCFIKQREELNATNKQLSPQDYETFIRGIAQSRGIGCVSVQGEEPLLPDTLPYTFSVLRTANEVCAPAAIITNGTHLEETIDDLAKYALEELTVSLDSADSATHDAMRGKEGTYKKVVRGLRATITKREIASILSIASVLLPGKVSHLLDMPEFLSDLGVHKWFVTPAIRVGENVPGGPVESWTSLIGALQRLSLESEKYGVVMIVEDEYNCLKEARKAMPPSRPLRFRNLDHPGGVLRLLPSGACDVGHEILAKHKADTIWDPEQETLENFLARLPVDLPKSPELV